VLAPAGAISYGSTAIEKNRRHWRTAAFRVRKFNVYRMYPAPVLRAAANHNQARESEQYCSHSKNKAQGTIRTGAGHRQRLARELARCRWCHGGRGIAGHQRPALRVVSQLPKWSWVVRVGWSRNQTDNAPKRPCWPLSLFSGGFALNQLPIYYPNGFSG
jgi:hypothetical protein